jgi:hypothetical protein
MIRSRTFAPPKEKNKSGSIKENPVLYRTGLCLMILFPCQLFLFKCSFIMEKGVLCLPVGERKLSEERAKSEPISHWEDTVRI